MIVVYTGRRPNAPGAEGQFPAGNADDVLTRLRQLFAALEPRLAVGSAAAGADLLAIQALLDESIDVRVVLAADSGPFREESVADRGEGWGLRFDGLISRCRVESVDGGAPAERFRKANARIIARVRDARLDDEPVMVVSVLSSPKGEDDFSFELVEAGHAEGFASVRIDPATNREQRPTAFVAMPYGAKPDPFDHGRAYASDPTYRRILTPALIDAGYEPLRADSEAAIGMIDTRMLRLINEAELFIGDLATHNANVMWELGVRHAWRSRRTMMIAPQHVDIPFDTGHVTVHKYDRDTNVVTDQQMVEALAALRPVLASIQDQEVTSPVFQAFPGLSEPHLPPSLNPAADERYESVVRRISVSADLGNADDLLAMLQETHDSVLPADAARALRAQLGLALVRCGRHDDAAGVLRESAEADTDFDNEHLQQQYAHALIRARDPDLAHERLEQARVRLRALDQRHPGSGETLGLIGSIYKRRVEEGASADQLDATNLDRAISAYERGFRLDPANYYPGINAVALLRLRGQHANGGQDYTSRARALLPVVDFSLARLGEPDVTDVWATATAAELNLHRLLLGSGDTADGLERVAAYYARATMHASDQQRDSMLRQLQLLRDAGDPADVVDRIVTAVLST